MQPHPPWVRPPARPALIPPPPPPLIGFARPPQFYSQPPCPPRGFYPRFVPPRPPPVVDPEQLWLDSFKRSHCNSKCGDEAIAADGGEPPLRELRRRVVQAQKIVEQLKVAAMELAVVENRRETLSASSEDQQDADEDAAVGDVEISRLRVQHERKLAVCEALKKQLEAMNAQSGLIPEKQVAEIRAFAARVNKKKTYRKRAKLRRRVEASLRRAVAANEGGDAESTSEVKLESRGVQEGLEGKENRKEKITPSPYPDSGSQEKNTAYLSAAERRTRKQTLDPETLTIDTLISVRRAWDAYIVYSRTPGAASIPPHFVPPPLSPSAQWAMFVDPSTSSSP